MRLGDTLKKNFAKNLQTLRTRKELTQAKLADALNEQYKDEIDLQRTSIVNYESAAAMPRIETLQCIADYFEKTVDQMISASMDEPGSKHSRMAHDFASNPILRTEMERRSSAGYEGAGQNTVLSSDPNLNNILTNCVEGIIYRQFYVGFLKNLFQQLQHTAANDQDREKYSNLFYKTFLGCQLSNSKYFQDVAGEVLDEQEFSVFMAFKDHTSTISIVAKGLKMPEDEVLDIFNRAQGKISLALEENTKTDLS